MAFLDADDVWASHKLREQLAIIEEHPEVHMVCGAVRYWRSSGGRDDVDHPVGARAGPRRRSAPRPP